MRKHRGRHFSCEFHNVFKLRFKNVFVIHDSFMTGKYSSKVKKYQNYSYAYHLIRLNVGAFKAYTLEVPYLLYELTNMAIFQKIFVLV